MSEVTIDQRGNISIITLDRPPVNAIGSNTIAELRDALNVVNASRETSVAILRSGNPKIFSAGADLHDSAQRYRTDGRRTEGGYKNDPRDQVDPGKAMRELFWDIYDGAVPVIAAVHGKAIGAGAALVASCDMIVASTDASFALTEINVGLLGGVRHMQRLVGPFLAKRMVLTGEFVPADELYRRGAIEMVVDPLGLFDTAVSLAAVIASKSPIAIRMAKESANRVEDLPLKDGYRTEQDYTLRIRRHTDATEASSAWSEKRTPLFQWE